MSGVTMAGVALGAMGGLMLNSMMGDSGGSAAATPTPPPVTPAPTPMGLTPKSQQKKTEQTMALATAGQLTPQATLLSGNEKRSVLGG